MAQENETPVKEENVIPQSIKATFYTDGGCRPSSRGYGGWGYHGQIGDLVYDGWGYIDGETTNNAAEVIAANEAINLARAKGVDELIIRSDSKYMLEGIQYNCNKWERNNWKRHDGTDVPNTVHWKVFINDVECFKQDASVTWEWVKGHNGDAGNEWADRNATKGVMLSTNGHKQSFSEAVEVKKHGKVKPSDYNRMFSHKHWYFNTRTGALLSSQGHTVYHCGNHEIIGKPESEASHSVIFLKEPDEHLEKVRDFQDSLMGRDERLLFTAKTDAIFSGKVYHELSENGTIHMGKRFGHRDLETVDKTNITQEVNPPRLAFNLMTMLSAMEQRLEKVISDKMDADWRLTDITNLLYDEVTKGKGKQEKIVYEIKSTLDPSIRVLELEVDYCTAKGMTEKKEIKLTFGIDIPTRNSLAALKKVKPSVSILTWSESDYGFRHAIIIKTEDDVGIWSSGHANLRVL